MLQKVPLYALPLAEEAARFATFILPCRPQKGVAATLQACVV